MNRVRLQKRSPEEEAAHLLKKAAKQQEKAKKRAKRRLSLVAITLSVFLSWLGSTVFVTIHGMLASELGVSHARVKLALASYSVALIMAAVAGGRMADILGRKRMFIIGGLAFSAAALLGLTVTNLWSLVAVRAFTGLSAALVLTATGGVLVSTVHGTTRHDGWLLWRGAGMAGMVLGPVIGPLVASGSSWRSLFVADAVFMLIAVGLGAYAMKERRDKDSVFTFALLLPAVLLGLGLLSPYLALLMGKEGVASWPLSVAIVVAGIACLWGFAVLNRRSLHPLFDTNVVLHNRRMWVTDLFGAIHVGALFVVVSAFPVILDADAHLSSAEIGIHMLALTIPLITLHLLAHRLRTQYALTRPMRDLDRVQPHRPQHGVVVCGRLPEPDVSHDLAVAPADGHRIRPHPPLRPYGRHQADRQTVGIHALRHTDFQQPRGHRRRCGSCRVCPAGGVEERAAE